MKIALVAGEASGDIFGASLMGALSSLESCSFHGIGGPLMREKGLSSFFPYEELSCMGVQILPRLPHLIKRFYETVSRIKEFQPDVLVTIDAPEFNLRLGKKLKGLGFPIIHCVAPSVWAWRPGRAKTLGEKIDHLFTLFPFEPPYFPNIPTTYIGHPLIQDIPSLARSPQDMLCLMPGSRKSELHYLLPILKRVIQQVSFDRIVLPTLPHLVNIIRTQMADLPKIEISTNPEEKELWMKQSRCAVVASGTACLELALWGLPHVAVYKVNPLVGKMMKYLLKTPYVTLPNIIMGKQGVPELLQEECTPSRILEEINILKKTQTQESFFQAMRKKLETNTSPSLKAAHEVLRIARHET